MKKIREELIVNDENSMAIALYSKGSKLYLTIGGVETVVMTKDEVKELVAMLKKAL